MEDHHCPNSAHRCNGCSSCDECPDRNVTQDQAPPRGLWLSAGVGFCVAKVGERFPHHEAGDTYPASLVVIVAAVVCIPLALGYMAGKDSR